jgi:putative acetyltransferase
VTERLERSLRAVTDADADGLVALVAAAYDEHPGCVLDLPGVDADLVAPATTAARRGGRWWVVEDHGRIVASVGTGPVDDAGTLELKRLYVAASHRRRGLASALVDRVERHAAGLGASEVTLWSDTRFDRAHALYDRRGYDDTGDRRQLHDPSDTTEIRFLRTIDPAPPRRTVAWVGPAGTDRCTLHDLPDGACLRGRADGMGVRYDVEVDHAWRTRTVRVEEAADGRVRWLASDGGGRWWDRDGTPVDGLAGCLDVDVEVTPATNTLPIRRGATGAVRAAWIRVPGPDVQPLEQRYERTGTGWRYASGRFGAELTVDEDGLVRDYGDVWHRTEDDVTLR